MKNLLTYILLILCIACSKQNATKESNPKNTKTLYSPHEDTAQSFSEETLEIRQEKTKSIKRKTLTIKHDHKSLLQDLVITKKLYIEEDFYVLDYSYPYLNEDLNKGYAVFNTYISENYLDIEATENEILEDKIINCDKLQKSRCMDKRVIDYKIYNAKNNLISVVLYKENYYSGMKHSTYMFECINFEVEKRRFVYYDDFFDMGSESDLRAVLNTQIKQSIRSGEMYYECWEISNSDFRIYKNNFVINDDNLIYYFDDCIICPSYTGTYSIEIPITKVMHLIKSYNDVPAIGQ